MLDDNARDKRELISRISRNEMLDEWREDPERVRQEADDAELELHAYLRARAPASEQSRGRSTAEWLLFHEGFQLEDVGDIPASRIGKKQGVDIDPQKGERMNDISALLCAYWDERYNRTLLTGKRTQRAASLSTQTVGSPWRRQYDEAPQRSPEIAVGFDIMRVMAYSRTISEDKFRVPQWRNATGEQMMQNIAEGTEPRLFEITRRITEVTMENYRAGIEATDAFLNDSQTRASDITNAVEEIAEGHRIAILAQFGKLLKESVRADHTYTPSVGDKLGGITFATKELTYPFVRRFFKEFGTAYRPDVIIGNTNAILDLELMSMTGGDQNLSFGSWTLIPNSGIENLNGDLTRLSYGEIDADTITGFTDWELFAFQRNRAFAFLQMRGMDQDEMERVAGRRMTRRWLGTRSAIAPLDLYALRRMVYGT